MTVAELLKKLGAAFPAFNAGAMEAWAPAFRAVCQAHEGPVLAQAYTAVLTAFSVRAAKALFPVPADFAAQLPSRHPKLTRQAALRLRTHGERMRRLMAEWRPPVDVAPEVRRALEHIALQVADEAAWHADAKPVVLTRQQHKLAEQRALSQQRRSEHGPPEGFSGEAWWTQISAIAARWQLAVSREEWGV